MKWILNLKLDYLKRVPVLRHVLGHFQMFCLEHSKTFENCLKTGFSWDIYLLLDKQLSKHWPHILNNGHLFLKERDKLTLAPLPFLSNVDIETVQPLVLLFSSQLLPFPGGTSQIFFFSFFQVPSQLTFIYWISNLLLSDLQNFLIVIIYCRYMPQ